MNAYRTGALLAALLSVGLYLSIPKEAAAGAVQATREWIATLGPWALPVFVGLHSLAIALCFPYAVGFEAAAGLLFGLLRGVACVVAAKALGASLTFWVGRAVIRNWEAARQLVQGNKYCSIVRRGVTKDGWKFVLLARFSPMPSYIVSYSLAATDVRFFQDYLLPTLAGGIPMILQNTSLGTFTTAAAAAAPPGGPGAEPDGPLRRALSLLFPALGLLSGGLVTWRIQRYTKQYQFDSSLGPGAEEASPRAAAESVAAAQRAGEFQEQLGAVDGEGGGGAENLRQSPGRAWGARRAPPRRAENERSGSGSEA